MSIIYQKILKGYDFKKSAEFNQDYLYTWEEYSGLCLKSFSKNDDLYMIVWDTETNKPKNVKYATHGVKSISLESYADATQEIYRKYNDYLKKERRSKEAKKLIELRKKEQLTIKKHSYSLRRLRTLYKIVGYNRYIFCLDYLMRRCIKLEKKHLQNKLKAFILSTNEIKNPFNYNEWNYLGV